MNARTVAALAALAALAAPALALAAEQAAHEREAIVLTVGEQDYLIAEMHANVEALESLFAALSRNDARSAQAAAATRGTASFHSRDAIRPKTLAAKFPPPWKAMSESLRKEFDALEAGIASGESTGQSLERTARLLALCTGCHATYRFSTAE